MIEFYLQIKWVHVAAVLASGSLFMLRGLAVNVGAAWAMATPVRYRSFSASHALTALWACSSA